MPKTETPSAIDNLRDFGVIRPEDAVAECYRLLRERGELMGALQCCVDAAAHDIVEDFSMVSNAADAALVLLARMKDGK